MERRFYFGTEYDKKYEINLTENEVADIIEALSKAKQIKLMSKIISCTFEFKDKL